MNAQVAMTPFAATVRYRFSDDGESRDASFHGLFFDRSEQAVLGRLREAHRFSPWVEVDEVQWREGGGVAAQGDRRSRRQYFVSPSDRRERIPLRARNGCWWGAEMETMAGTRDSGVEGAHDDDGRWWRPRRHARCRMFKPAHVVLENAVLDCVLLDLSPGGAQVYLIARTELPERV